MDLVTKSIRLPKDLHNAMKSKASLADMPMEQAYILAATAWLEGNQTSLPDFKDKGLESAVPARLRPYLRKLAEVLVIGNERAVETVTRVIDLSLEHSRAARSPLKKG